jgi:hypothetical protein
VDPYSAGDHCRVPRVSPWLNMDGIGQVYAIGVAAGGAGITGRLNVANA